MEFFKLKNNRGMEVVLSDYGARIIAIRVPDGAGVLADVTLGHEDLDDWMADTDPYFGCVAGRYCNRIAAGCFDLDGKSYRLATNNPPNHLHGGMRGFDKRLWQASREGEGALSFRYTSPDGEEGYPGALTARVTYAVAAKENTLTIQYEAVSDQATPVSLTNHAYFNLSGEGEGDVLGHTLQVLSDQYIPVDAHLIPTGRLAPVAGTPFDFRVPKPVGKDLASDDVQLQRAGGYDHCWVLAPEEGRLRLAAVLGEPERGRRLEVLTTEPGIQVYTGNFLDGSATGKCGKPLLHRGGICLETQAFPDSPNQPEFPDVVLRPGEIWESCTVFRFS